MAVQAQAAPIQQLFPVQVEFEVPSSSSRLWAIPILGMFIKVLALIPHAICLYVLGAVVGLLQLVIWIPVLFTGHYPGWAFTLVSGTLRWLVRVWAFAYGLTDRYPPFSLSS